MAVAVVIALLLHAVGLPVASAWIRGGDVEQSLDTTALEPSPRDPFEPIDGDDDRPVDQATPAADLSVEPVSIPERMVVAGDATLRFVVRNVGEAKAVVGLDSAGLRSADPWWSDAAYLSADTVWDISDAELGRAEALSRLSVAGSYDVALEASVPSDATTGAAYVLLVADAGGVVQEAGREGNNVVAVPVQIRPAAEDPPSPILGADEATPRVTVAWISHEAFEELLAGPDPSETIQPVLQANADPVPGAPLRTGESTPAASDVAAAPSVAASEPIAAEASERPVEPGEVRERQSAADPLTYAAEIGEPALASESDATQAADREAEATDPAENTEPESSPASQPAIAESDSLSEPSPSAAAEATPSEPNDEAEPRPSSAPRGATDAEAADLKPVPVYRAGRVEVAEGLTVKPSRPDFSVPALVTAVPRNPRVRITFDVDGVVLDADLIDSAGSRMLDAPIRASLYRWRASGSQLSAWEGPRQFTFTILLTRTTTLP